MLGKIFAITFILWLTFMWLVGIWHLMNVLFSWVASRLQRTKLHNRSDRFHGSPRAVILYTTCNDFDPVAFKTCLSQSYDNYEVLVCDDSDKAEYVYESVNSILADMVNHPPVTIVHRTDRTGFKAGNMNNALKAHGNRFQYFAVADADEILPTSFLSKCISLMVQDPDIGFAQCAHSARSTGATDFASRHSIAIAGHWRHFVPVREHYGFLSFYGHGAVIRTEAWRKAGGFPEIVSEDLAFTFILREKGYRGIYVPEVVCQESFPPDFQAMTKRTGKWVRGTMQFLRTYGIQLLKSSRIKGVEKLDAIFCALGLLLPLPFIVVILLIAGIYFGNQYEVLRVALGGMWKDPLVLVMGLIAMLSPMVYTLAEIPRAGLKVVKQLVFSAGTYLALAPHSAWEQLGYLFSGRADFPVTGSVTKRPQSRFGTRDMLLVILAGVLLGSSIMAVDLLLMGVAVAFLLGVMCRITGRVPLFAWCASFVLVMIGILLMPVSLLAAPLTAGTSFAAHQ
jgi:cellulose synthase/poly-beta-1,6-N-acetylglucosamine synthase-like glycosyltransferase